MQEYLNLKEAAEALGMGADELVEKTRRHEIKIRAFADGGSFKFRKQEIEEYVRQAGIGSGAEIVFGDLEDDPVSIDSGSSDEILLSDLDGPSGSGARVIGMDGSGRTASDSDVRLVPEPPAGTGSDSDVRLISGEEKPPSDSDVKIVSDESAPSDSDVKIVPDSEDASDSDVKIKGPAPSDSDIRLEKPPGDSGLELTAPGADSGLELTAPGADSGLELDGDPVPTLANDEGDGSSFEMSGFAEDSEFELADSGFGDLDDSAMTLALDDKVGLKDDGGIKGPKSPSDSDVTAQSPSSSGLSLDSPADSGIALDSPIDAQSSGLDLGTDGSSGSGDDLFETDFDVPSLDSDSDFELSNTGDSEVDTAQLSIDSDFELSDSDFDGASDESSQVVALEGEDDVDESASTQMGAAPVAEEWEADDDQYDDFDEVDEIDDVDDMDADLDEESDDMSVGPAPMVASSAQADWGMGWVVTLGFSTVFMLLIGVVMVDMVRTMWGWYDGSQPYSSGLLDFMAGFLPK